MDELFARIKADRAAAAAAAPPPPPPPGPAETDGLPQPVDADPADAEPAVDADPAAVAIGTVADAVEAPESTDAGPDVESQAEAQPEPDATPSASASADVADERARARRDELLDPAEDALARQLKRVLQDEQNEVLDRLRRKRRRQNGSPLLAAEEQAGRFREAAEPVLEGAVRAGVRFADPKSDRHTDVSAARDVARALAREIAEPLRKRLEEALADAPPNGDGDRDGSELSELISSVYRQWRAQDLEPLVRHHAAVAFGVGAYAASRDDDAGLRWVVDDEAPCPDCDDNALAGTVAKGQPYPTGQLHPPAHPGCRCLLVPAIS